jgi:hypothetical protein
MKIHSNAFGFGVSTAIVTTLLVGLGGASLVACSHRAPAGPTNVVGQIDGVQTKLPPVAGMTNVFAALNDDSVSITFDPVDGALDYRVYVLPDDSDIDVGADGGVVVQNGTYRCAGNRESPSPMIDNGPSIASDGVRTLVDNQMVGGYTRTLADATIGYVYTQPGPGLEPVYVLGESDPNADTTCFFARWEASRTKLYTTSSTVRAQGLAALDRDDGIAFYVPSSASSATAQVYIDESQVGTPDRDRFYFPDGPEAAAHPNKTPAFFVMTTQVSGTVPLMRVYYSNSCGWSHDELAVGQERFNRIYHQGDRLPWWSLLWTGINAPTTLVVEALDSVCPYQGLQAPTSLPSVTALFGSEPLLHQPFVTVDDMRDASPNGEVFLNGQNGPAWRWSGNAGDAGMAEDAASPAAIAANTGATLPRPNAIARAFLRVAPLPHPPMDFLKTFHEGDTPETFTDVPCGVSGGNCFATWRQQSASFDQMFLEIEHATPDGSQGLYSFGPTLGEWLVTYGDIGADTNGKYRLTANPMANLDTSTFLHVTMEVDAYTTSRRYPQILISDQPAPVQYNLASGHTLVIETFGEATPTAVWPIDYQLEICSLRTWDVNNQCPKYDLYHLMNASGMIQNLAPNDEVGEHASTDHRILFDVYASTSLVYLFLDGAPYGCAQLPATGAPGAGPVSVTWGDVLYHSAVDIVYAYHQEHLQIETRRHFDNLGFSSGVPAPAWDDTRFPCVAPISL